ncbi:DUF1009 domain-containing protein [Candidatus Dependentiae bacterium]|nr:DUF1009 domain-containing protein [Candidatus Dependentiae bacterium]
MFYKLANHPFVLSVAIYCVVEGWLPIHINKKFDLPTLGPKSLKQIKKGQVKAIAWHSDKTFIANKNEFIKKAKELNITLVSYN